MFDLLKGKFFDADEGGASSEPAGTPVVTPPSTTHPDSQGVLRAKPTNVKKFLDKAPVMNKVPQGALPGPEGGAPAPQPNVPTEDPPKTGEGVKKEPVVAGPAFKQPVTDPKTGKPAVGEVPKEGEADGLTAVPGQKIKIGNLEHTAEEWEQFGKDYANDTTWKARNTKKSQLSNKFSDEMLNDMAPYALGQRELPKDIKKSLMEAAKLPDEITVKDDDGYDIKVKTSDIFTEDAMKAMKAKFLSEAYPEYMKAAEENTNLKTQLETTQHDVTIQEIETGTSESIKFMQGHPEFAVTVHQGEKLDEVLANIYRSGDAHPEYENFTRFTALLKMVSDGVFPTFDDAYTSFYGNNDAKKAANLQVAQNQALGKPEEPGGKSLPPDSGKSLLDRMSKRGKGVGYSNLGRA